MSERVLMHREPAFVENERQIYRQHIEWRDPEGKVIQRGIRMVNEDGSLYRSPPRLKYESFIA